MQKKQDELTKLAIKVENSTTFRSQWLEAIVGALDGRRIPQNSSAGPSAQASVNLALAAFHVLSKCERHVPRDRALQSMLVDQWPAIGGWLCYILTACILDKLGAVEIAPPAWDTVNHASGILNGHDPLRRLMNGTPGLVKLYTQCWLEADQLVENRGRDDLAPVLNVMLEDFAHTNFHEVLQAAGGEASVLAKKLLRRLYFAMTQKVNEHVIVTIAAPMSLIMTLSLGSHALAGPMLEALLELGGMRLVTKCALIVLAQRWEVYQVDTVRKCFLLIRSGCTRPVDGRTWLLQSLHSGLLRAILHSMALEARTRHKSDQEANLVHSTCVKVLEDTVVPSLIYRPVVRVIVRQGARSLPTGRLSAPHITLWSKFLGTAEKFTHRKAFFDSTHGKRCASCETIVERHGRFSLMECSACKGARYCSYGCQKKDWSNHKQVCARWRSDIAGNMPVSPMTLREYQFIRYIAKDELEMRQEQYQAILRRKFPLPTPLHALSFSMDTMDMPFKLDIEKKSLELCRTSQWNLEDTSIVLSISVLHGGRELYIQVPMHAPNSLHQAWSA